MSVHRPVTPEDWARRREIDARAYVRKRNRFYAAHRRGSVCQVKHGGQPCGYRLRDVVDRFGRVHAVCERCERKHRGICGLCPRPVEGTKGKAMYCKDCKRRRKNDRAAQWAKIHPEQRAAIVRRRRRRLREQVA